MTSLSKLGVFFSLAILSKIRQEILSKQYKCTLKMILRNDSHSFYTVFIDVKPSGGN